MAGDRGSEVGWLSGLVAWWGIAAWRGIAGARGLWLSGPAAWLGIAGARRGWFRGGSQHGSEARILCFDSYKGIRGIVLILDD